MSDCCERMEFADGFLRVVDVEMSQGRRTSAAIELTTREWYLKAVVLSVCGVQKELF